MLRVRGQEPATDVTVVLLADVRGNIWNGRRLLIGRCDSFPPIKRSCRSFRSAISWNPLAGKPASYVAYSYLQLLLQTGAGSLGNGSLPCPRERESAIGREQRSDSMTSEHHRLDQARTLETPWKKWGPTSVNGNGGISSVAR